MMSSSNGEKHVIVTEPTCEGATCADSMWGHFPEEGDG